MSKYVLNFGEWLNEQKLLEISIKDYKSRNRIKRFLDEALEINESNIEYFKQTKKYKDDLDDLITQKIIDYVNFNAQINEGFWSDLVDKAKEVGGKAIDAVKKVITKVGDFINSIKFFLKKSLSELVDFARVYFIKEKDTILNKDKVNKIKKDFEEAKLDAKKVKEDAILARDHTKFIFSKEPFIKLFDDSAKTNDASIKAFIDKESEKDEQQNAQKALVSNESFINILDLFKDEELLEQIINNDIEKLFEAETEKDPTQITEDDIKKNKIWTVVSKIIEFLVVGLGKQIEEWLTKSGEKVFEKITGWNNSKGGPQKSSLPTIALIVASSVGLILEVGTAVLKGKMGVVTKTLYYAIHGTSILGLFNIILHELLENNVLYWIILLLGCVISLVLILKELGILGDEDVKEINDLKIEDMKTANAIVAAI